MQVNLSAVKKIIEISFSDINGWFGRFKIKSRLINKDGYRIDYSLVYDISKKTMFITVRGSNDIPDWVANLDFEQVETGDNIKFHRGYYTQAQLILDDILPDILEFKKKKNSKLIFCSYSAGAAISSILGYLLTNEHWDNSFGFISLGCPVFTNDAGAAWFNVNNYYHFFHMNDGVVKFPGTDKLGYSYISTHLFPFNKKGEILFSINPYKAIKSPVYSNRLIRLIWGIYHYHNFKHYSKMLDNNKKIIIIFNSNLCKYKPSPEV